MTKNRERTIELMKNAQKEFASDFELFIIPKKNAKRIVAYGAMRYDLELILGYVGILKEKNDDIYASALTYAIISLYGKCFTDATGRKYPKLEPKNLFLDNPDLEVHHKYLMELRHNFIAHRGETEGEIGISYYAVKKDEPTKTQLKYRQIKLSGFAKERLQNFEKLFDFVYGVINEKFIKAGERNYGYMLDNLSQEEWKKLNFTRTK